MTPQFKLSSMFLTHPKPEIRELPSVDLWSAELSLNLPHQRFINELGNVAIELDQSIHGFTAGNLEPVTNFTRIRSPRAMYGIVTPDQCQEGVDYLAQLFDSPATEQQQFVGKGFFRVVLGLKDPYRYRNEPPYHVDEVIQRLGHAYTVTAGESISIILAKDLPIPETQLMKECTRIRVDPAAIIYGAVSNMGNVYRVAERFKQHRFTVENFDTGKAYMVETKHANPDQTD